MNERKCSEPSEKQRLSSWWPKQGNNAGGQEYSGTPIPHIRTLQRATRIRSRRAIGEEFLKKKRRGRFQIRGKFEPGYVGATSPDFSLLKYRPPIPAFPMWGSRRALPVCEDASVVQNDGISQDGMTCTVIPIVLRALPCCCTVVAHGCADWERGCSLRLIRRVVLQDGVHSGKGAPVKCFTERTGQ